MQFTLFTYFQMSSKTNLLLVLLAHQAHSRSLQLTRYINYLLRLLTYLLPKQTQYVRYTNAESQTWLARSSTNFDLNFTVCTDSATPTHCAASLYTHIHRHVNSAFYPSAVLFKCWLGLRLRRRHICLRPAMLTKTSMSSTKSLVPEFFVRSKDENFLCVRSLISFVS